MRGTSSHRASTGSPPRAWGRRRVRRRFGATHRFTPTCVGTAMIRVSRSVKTSVHPHVRGGRPAPCPPAGSLFRFTPTCVGTASSALAARVGRSGSPPRAWGRPCRRARFPARMRFTPTCVGTAWHPNAEGTDARFTPTCVGTAHTTIGACYDGSVHPHVRGDGLRLCPVHKVEFGSPPRAWGRRRYPVGTVAG